MNTPHTRRHGDLQRRIDNLTEDLLAHDGCANLTIEMRLRRGQKEVTGFPLTSLVSSSTSVGSCASNDGAGTMSTCAGAPQEIPMDPSTPRGVRQLPTLIDYAGFADIGWQVSAVPEPSAGLLLGPGTLLVRCVAVRRARRTAP